ncbi:hypothetical protein DRJ48_00705 [Candidatus Woesearchaeota archaeon]|nr:hypothetical protein [Candidatus Woesearchaeota archaeon]RLE43525.1 MAG: hypothetical protein DRJ48_00705 [Candidatus Woesearchaeota archaeon]
MGISKRQRGYYFTFDAVFATILIMLILKVGLSQFMSEPDLSVDYRASDIANILAELTIREMDTDFVRNLTQEGLITNPENTIAEQVGEFYSQDNLTLARGLLEDFASHYLPSGQDFGVWVDSELIFNTSTPLSTSILSTKRMVSGITKRRKRTGFLARAYAKKTKKNTTQVVMGDVIYSSVKKPGGGNNQNKVNITYRVSLPSNLTINDAWWFIEAAYTDNKFKAYINGEYIPGSDGTGDKLIEDLESYFHPGENTARVVYRFGSSGELGGDDGASHLVISYETNITNTMTNINYHYFGEVRSRCSIRYKKPIFALGNITSMHVNLTLNATQATLYFVYQGQEYTVSTKNVTNKHVLWNNTEIESAFESNGIHYSNLTGEYFWFIVDLDTFNEREYLGDWRILYNNSYVYTEMDLPTDVYGYIDITQEVEVKDYHTPLLGNFYRYLNWEFNVSNITMPLYLDSQFAWLYYTGSDPSQVVSVNGQALYSHPPQPLIVELARFGFLAEHMRNGTNNYTQEFGWGYAINPDKSFAVYTFMVRNFVSYGNTFDTEEEALEDAIARLNQTLGDFSTALDISSEVVGLSQVPSLWGPMIIEVRTW